MIADHFKQLFQAHEDLRQRVEVLTESGRNLSANELKDRCVELCADFDVQLDRIKAFLATLSDGPNVEQLQRAFANDRSAIDAEINAVKNLNCQAKTFYDEALRRITAIDTKICFARSLISEHRSKVLRMQLDHLEAEVQKGLGSSASESKD